MDYTSHNFVSPDPTAAVASALFEVSHRDTLSITVDAPSGDLTVVHVAGDIDLATESELNACLTDVADGGSDLILDLHDVGFIGYRGLALLDTTALRLRFSDACVAVVGDRHIRRALHIAGADRMLSCYGTIEAASNGIRHTPIL